MTVLSDILVPVSLLRTPSEFGGTRQGDCLRGDLIPGDQYARGMKTAPPTDSPRMVLPAFAEAHCHLDKCDSIGRMGPIGGDLQSAIAAQIKDKDHWTEDDLRNRMSRGLDELVDAGCTLVRSHIDWSQNAEPPLAWSILHHIASTRTDISVQTAALTGIDQMADQDFCTQIARGISKQNNAVLGSFILYHDPGNIRVGLANVFSAAEQFSLPLDFHVDEGLGDWNGLEAICDAAIASSFTGPILCGHAVSLMDRCDEDFARITEKLLETKIHICALPTTNLYLQGRNSGTPDRRGITRLRELDRAGVPIVVASDNVRDAFCPMGQHDPRAALHLASLAAHLDPPFGQWLPAITKHARQALGKSPSYVEVTPLSDLRLTEAATTADLIAGRKPLIRLIDERSPA